MVARRNQTDSMPVTANAIIVQNKRPIFNFKINIRKLRRANIYALVSMILYCLFGLDDKFIHIMASMQYMGMQAKITRRSRTHDTILYYFIIYFLLHTVIDIKKSYIIVYHDENIPNVY